MCDCCRVTVVESNLVVAWTCLHGLSWATKTGVDAAALTAELTRIEAALRRQQMRGAVWKALRLMKGARHD